MTDVPPRKSFSEMRRELAEKKGKPLPESTPERKLQVVPDEFVPDVGGDRSEEDLQIDSIINGIDPISAYRKWIGKEVNEREVNQEECHISCPFPNHRDKNPSAWILTRDKGSKPKGTWFCGGCQEGGDIHDLAAIGLSGHDENTYRDGKNFHDLRKGMAESFGYIFKAAPGGEDIIFPPQGDDSSEGPGTDSDSSELPREEVQSVPEPSDDSSTEDRQSSGQEVQKEASVTPISSSAVDDEFEEKIDYPRINWANLIPEKTFLGQYMRQCSNDDSPEEYHFWHGLLAVGHAGGRNVFLDDTKLVYGNLLVCLLGGTGYGKSRSRGWLDTVVEEALPFTDNGLDCSGVKLVPTPASGENLINQFQHIAWDPSLPKGMIDVRTPVNGIVDYDEFSGLLARAGRQGSTLKPIIHGFADSRDRISTSSNTGGTFIAVKPFCSITATTQPKAVRELLSRNDAGSGFLNRWLFVGGPRKEKEIVGGRRSGIRVDLTEPIDYLKKIKAWASIEREVGFTDDGYKRFEKFFKEEIFPNMDTDSTDLLSRLDLTMKRMILLYCINEKKLEADEDLVKRVEPILQYLIDCYAILNNEIGNTVMHQITQDIMYQIGRLQVKNGYGVSIRDIMKALKRKNYSPELIEKALKIMRNLDWIEEDKKNLGPGRPTIRYRVVAS